MSNQQRSEVDGRRFDERTTHTYTTTSINNKGMIQKPVRFDQEHGVIRHLCPSTELVKWRTNDMVVEHILVCRRGMLKEWLCTNMHATVVRGMHVQPMTTTAKRNARGAYGFTALAHPCIARQIQAMYLLWRSPLT
jgi:hypothetical protein